MKFVLFAVVLFVSFLIGTWGFCQIIGSLRTVRIRGLFMTLFTIILWSAILIGGAIAVHRWLYDCRIEYYIGTGISFLMSLRSDVGRNGVE